MGEKGGVMEVGLGKVDIPDDAPVPHPDLQPGPYLKLTVSDTGCGLTSEVMEHIFDPYFTTKKREEGTGLGLSVSHGIVKEHGGAITVRSEPGKGSNFNVYLPAIDKQVKEEAGKAEALPKGSEHILLIDGEEAVVDTSKRLLEKLG